jgi:hypothetical protein
MSLPFQLGFPAMLYKPADYTQAQIIIKREWNIASLCNSKIGLQRTAQKR